MLLKKINLNDSINIILEESGKPLTTQEFKNMLEDYLKQPRSEINFIIGGPDGTSKNLSKIANETISLSKMTLPHLMARVMLIEQIYRSLSIIINHPYHRD
jgi:23S rRNA (pseudouridine1915-N3)-methyltransferase